MKYQGGNKRGKGGEEGEERGEGGGWKIGIAINGGGVFEKWKSRVLSSSSM